MRRPRPVRLLQAVLAMALLGWVGGFLWFLHAASSMPATTPSRSDGIVVLTGGADRVETGLRLLAEDRARLLLVTGVERGTELPALARLARLQPGPLAGRVTIGHYAVSTRGNAAETASWADRNGIRSLIVVTAAYHMPRALAELSRMLPEVELRPVPVTPPALRRPADLGTWRLLASEYLKFLAVQAGLDRLMPSREAARTIPGRPA